MKRASSLIVSISLFLVAFLFFVNGSAHAALVPTIIVNKITNPSTSEAFGFTIEKWDSGWELLHSDSLTDGERIMMLGEDPSRWVGHIFRVHETSLPSDDWILTSITRDGPHLHVGTNIYERWTIFEMTTIDNPLNITFTNTNTAVPIPGAAWLLGSGFIAIVGVRRRSKK